jgi:glutamate racemase
MPLQAALRFDMIGEISKIRGDRMNTIDSCIGVFDSGVGGISVLRHLVRLMPQERFLYLGDSANAPYGTKSREEVCALSFAVAEKLLSRGIKALVVACNTATSAAIIQLRQAYPELIVVGIEPALKLAADRFPGGKLGVMATPMTLREEKFAALLQRFSHSGSIYTFPAPGLVELVERGEADSPEAEALLREILGAYAGELDALVLGCTHYPFAAGAISRVLGEKTVLLDGGEGTARETKRRLAEAGLLRTAGTGEVIIENSAADEALIRLSHQLLEL